MPYEPQSGPTIYGSSTSRRGGGAGGRQARGGGGKKPRAPRWALLCVVFGVIISVGSGGTVASMKVLASAATKNVTQQNLLGKANAHREHVTITGAKNILLVGVDTRVGLSSTLGTRADSIVLLHISAAHDQAYMVSLPRDSYVNIPAYKNGKTHWNGGKGKINGAFQHGSEGLSGKEALSHGFELLALTVKELTGITPDAGAIIDFEGFRKVVEVLGKICMNVDETTTSIHVGLTKEGNTAPPFTINTDGTVGRKTPGVKPNVYVKGPHCFTPVEALDFVRQRDKLENGDGDYGRQRHQQQFIKAIVKEVVSNGLSSPTKLPGLLDAFGKTMTVDDGDIPLEDWAYAMHGLQPENIVTFKTNKGTFNSAKVPGAGDVEILDAATMTLLSDMKNDTVLNFMQAHPDLVTTS